MVPGPESLPGRLRERLLALRPVLEQQGTIQPHHGRGRRLTYRLRLREFDEERGYRVQRSVELGDEDTAATVQAVIEGWRAERYAAKTAQRAAEREGRAALPEDRLQVRMAVVGRGGGGRRQRRAMRMYHEAAAFGPASRLMFAYKGEFMAVRRTGRPRRRIW